MSLCLYVCSSVWQISVAFFWFSLWLHIRPYIIHCCQTLLPVNIKCDSNHSCVTIRKNGECSHKQIQCRPVFIANKQAKVLFKRTQLCCHYFFRIKFDIMILHTFKQIRAIFRTNTTENSFAFYYALWCNILKSSDLTTRAQTISRKIQLISTICPLYPWTSKTVSNIINIKLT